MAEMGLDILRERIDGQRLRVSPAVSRDSPTTTPIAATRVVDCKLF
jgi:hypothetical protein